MDRARPDLGLRLVVTPGHGPARRPGPGRDPGPDHDPAIARPLGPGLALEVTGVAPGGQLVPVGPDLARRWGWGSDPDAILARAEAAMATLPAQRHLWRLDSGCWLTLLRAGPFTTALVADLARRVPHGAGHGLVSAPDPGTLAVVSAARTLDRAELGRARELLGGLARAGSGTIRWLIQFHPAGEFAIFGTGQNRPDHHLS